MTYAAGGDDIKIFTQPGYGKITAHIQAFAIYNIALTGTQVLAISDAMAAL
jgi:hypothetical protein